MRKDIELYNTALDFAEMGDWKSTIAHVYQAIALERDEPAYHSLLAVAYLGCRARRIPVVQINPELDENQPDFEIYTKLARRAFYNAFLIDPGDLLLDSYMSWLFGNGSDHYGPPPNENPPHPDPAPKPSSPNFPMDSAAANFIEAEAVTQVP